MKSRPDLIYDVGMHKGEDTDYYLRKGFNVIGFEANPTLAMYCRERFKDAIQNGNLNISEGAIAPKSAGERIDFFENLENSVWGTVSEYWVERNEKLGTHCRKIEVNRTDIDDAFKDFGVPFYLKIDIEGAEDCILESLKGMELKPKFISIEAEKLSFGKLRKQMDSLSQIGYRKFKIVQQAGMEGKTIYGKTIRNEEFVYSFQHHASGPFGDDVGQPWVDKNSALRELIIISIQYKLFGHNSMLSRIPGGWRLIEGLQRWYGKPLPGWHDIHASL